MVGIGLLCMRLSSFGTSIAPTLNASLRTSGVVVYVTKNVNNNAITIKMPERTSIIERFLFLIRKL
ncbi:hypothetical protein B1H56_04710 [Christensenella minuta]|nr:hypothetical protein B1H56_04710 [Christensenella minuta]